MDKLSVIINILIPALGFIGTAIIAFSVNPVFKAIRNAFKLLEMQHDINLRSEFDKLSLKDLDKQIANFGGKKGTIWAMIGLGCVGLSYALQLYLLFK
ncbi:MAG: hypothetical protein P4L79_17490 [Legionella sp.]|uniref:hypothetical protein n=1 Tax=Legionella sp. TaxID=459 RepID=UPI00283E4D47|nr:hypothetical protein [Legionella sp.]